MADRPVFKIQIDPGTYSCRWDLGDGDLVRGELELRADRPPSGNAIWMVGKDKEVTTVEGHKELHYDFPQTVNQATLFGRLDSGQEVLLIDVQLETWWEDRTRIDAAAAIVGHEVPREDQPIFSAAEVQITALDALGGRPPISSTSFSVPDENNPSRKWIIERNGDSVQKWSLDEIEVQLSYNSRASTFDPYKFSAAFTPVLNIRTQNPISLREWIDDWCIPLRRIAGAATGRREEIAYLALEADGGWNVAVFGSGITQAPYESNLASVRDAKPAFTTARDGISLLSLIQGWKTQRDAGNPLIEVYDPVMLARQQHPRSRVLLLIQLLEALYGFENLAILEERSVKHAEKREKLVELLTKLRDDGQIETADLRFVKDRMPKDSPRSLDEALRAHFQSLPDTSILDELKDLPIIKEVASTLKPPTSENALRVVRNKLSHGERSYPIPELDNLARLLDRIVRAIFFRVLGCDADVSKRALDGERA